MPPFWSICLPGADPLGLGTEPKSLERFVEAEVINGRWAMLGVAGMLGVEALGYGDWYSAPLWAVTGGKATYFGAELPFQFDLGTLFAIVSAKTFSDVVCLWLGLVSAA